MRDKIEREERAIRRLQEAQNEKDKNPDEADEKDDDANNEEEEETSDEVKQQVWMVSSMSNVHADLIVTKNDKSKIPVVQFFFKKEKAFRGKYSDEEMAKREQRGEI